MNLVEYFNRELDEETKTAILRVFGANGSVSLEAMAPFFNYYRQEVKSSVILTPPPIRSHQAVIHVLELLKANATRPKAAIPLPDGAAAALDLGVRVMLVTACKSPGTVGGDVFNPVWKGDETLERFIDRVYPRWTAPTEERRNATISVANLTAQFLTHDARIRIEWTDRLTDHLELLVGANWKTIYVFRYPSYLKMCLKSLSSGRPELDHTSAASLVL